MSQTGSANLLETEGDLNVKSDIGLILPTYCDVSSIEKLVFDIENLNLNVRLLVIDDLSPDGTTVRGLQSKYKNVLLLVRSKKPGLGTALTDGFKVLLSLENPPSYTVTMDAYYSHNPKEMLSDLHSQKCEIQIETIRQACKRGSDVREFPMMFVNRKNGKSKLSADRIKGFSSYIFGIKRLKASAN